VDDVGTDCFLSKLSNTENCRRFRTKIKCCVYLL